MALNLVKLDANYVYMGDLDDAYQNSFKDEFSKVRYLKLQAQGFSSEHLHTKVLIAQMTELKQQVADFREQQ